MGWSSGTGLIIDIWDFIRPKLAEEDVEDVVMKLIELFEHHDWDNVDEFVSEFPEVEVIYKKYNDLDDEY